MENRAAFFISGLIAPYFDNQLLVVALMDAHSFIFIAQELACFLRGARVEKIHGPLPHVFVFSLFAQGQKTKLFFSYHKQNPCLFLSSKNLANPQNPRSDVMRLRKYIGNRRLGDALIHGASRRIAFPVLAGPDESVRYLLLDLRFGASLETTLPEDFFAAPAWPPPEITALFTNKAEPPEHALWAQYDVLTPLLRETLRSLDTPKALALMTDLEDGAGSLFCYTDKDGAPTVCTAWPLPAGIVQKKRLQELTAEATLLEGHPAFTCPLPGLDEPVTFPLLCERAENQIPQGEQNTAVEPPAPRMFAGLTLLSFMEEQVFFRNLSTELERREAQPERKKEKRQAKLLQKLDQERERLQKMVDLRQPALLLQQHLWRFAADEKQAEIFVPDETGLTQEMVRISLDPQKTIRENMAHMFHQSARGTRGLSFLEQRISNPNMFPAKGPTAANNFIPQTAREKRDTSYKALQRTKGHEQEKQLARFLSSDGLVILRGKNATGNKNILKAGQPHDYWLHSKNGPSAHVIIRRAHAGQDIPEQTLKEAAILAGLKSWQQEDSKAEIMVAELRHVRPHKGAHAGAALADKLVCTLVVTLDATLEARLGTEASDLPAV